ncbi:MAG: VacJ family lipoprotein [Holosporaceae bacterium]|jgi:phospholipid-binding lipoprotein MlaA|nr:VacJ family lipoprotein [Holosporaceae bacterium]
MVEELARLDYKNHILFLVLAGCSATLDNPDPHKEFNKEMLELNLALDKNVLKPVSSAYKDIVPDVMRESVSNFLFNLSEPFYFINYLITMDGEHAVNSFFRFAINSTLGILGFFDVGCYLGFPKAGTSHKDTLKKLEIPTGDYLVLPVLGASSTRDTVAEPISWFVDPVGYFIGFPYMCARFVLTTISDRAENTTIDSTIQNSVDVYSTYRSFYLQKYGENEKEDYSSD